MPPIRVDFYLAKEEGPDAIMLLACGLLENIYQESLKEPNLDSRHETYRLGFSPTLVICSTKHEAEKLDDLLWSFKAEAFIPHQLLTEMQEMTEDVPIIIAWDEALSNCNIHFSETLFNLSPKIPIFYCQFKRIIELVENSNTAKELSRMHYRQYRADGCDLFTHPL